MAKKHTIESYNFNVSSDFIVYILYGDASIFDFSGNEEDQIKVDEWLDSIIEEYSSGAASYHWGVDSTETEFKKCDIIDLYSSCINLKFTVVLSQ